MLKIPVKWPARHSYIKLKIIYNVAISSLINDPFTYLVTSMYSYLLLNIYSVYIHQKSRLKHNTTIKKIIKTWIVVGMLNPSYS